MRLGLGLSLTARLMGSTAIPPVDQAPGALSLDEWSVDPIDGDPNNVLMTLIAWPPQGDAPISAVKRDRYAGGVQYQAYNLRQGGSLPVLGTGYVVPAAPGIPNTYRLWCENGLGSPNYGSTKTVTPWVAAATATLTGPVDTATGATTASISVTTDLDSGTIYAAHSSTTPASGSALKTLALASGYSLSVTVAGEQTANITGLTAATAYDPVWFVHETAGGFSALVSGDGFTTATAAATTDTFTVNGTTVVLSQALPYRVHWDGNYTFELPGSGSVSVVSISTATMSPVPRGGAMWNPHSGIAGYGTTTQGFDQYIVTGGANSTSTSYSAALNVAPEANGGSAFVIPGEGSLVIAQPNLSGTFPATYNSMRTGQRPNKTAMVVTFMTSLPAAGTLRPPVRGSKTMRAGWTEAGVLARLDTLFPPTETLASAQGQSNVPTDLTKFTVTVQAGLYHNAIFCEPLVPSDGVPLYGDDWAPALGEIMLSLHRSDLSTADRERGALIIAQLAIDLNGMILDGAIYQSNGGHVNGRNFAMFAGAELLDDDYMRVIATGELGSEMAPGTNLQYLPFAEQRTHRLAVAAPRTTGTSTAAGQLASWGNYVGAGVPGNTSTEARPSAVTITAESVGQPVWCIGPDDNTLDQDSSTHPWAVYHTLGVGPLLDMRTAIEWLQHDAVSRGLIEEMIDCIDFGYWIDRDSHVSSQMADITRYSPGGADPKVFLSSGYTSRASTLPEIDRRTFKPYAFHPNVTETATGFTATLHPFAITCGLAITSTNLRWRLNGWAWTVESAYVSGTEVAHGGTTGDTLDVQVQVETSAGLSPWTVNHPNRINATNGAQAPRATITLAAASPFTVTVDALDYDRAIFDSAAHLSINTAYVPLEGTTDAPEGATIEARAVRYDDATDIATGAATAWIPIDIVASGGTWSGDLPVPLSANTWSRAQVRVQGSAASPVTVSERFEAGHVWAFYEQSNIAKVLEFKNWSTTSVLDPQSVTDPEALQHFFVDRSTGVFTRTFVSSNATEAASVGAGVVAISNTFAANRPGEKLAIACHVQSGTSPFEMIRDRATAGARPARAWDDEVTIHQQITACGQKVGLVINAGWVSWDTSGANDDRWLPIGIGKLANGTALSVGDPVDWSSGSPGAEYILTHCLTEFYDYWDGSTGYTMHMFVGPHGKTPNSSDDLSVDPTPGNADMDYENIRTEYTARVDSGLFPELYPAVWEDQGCLRDYSDQLHHNPRVAEGEEKLAKMLTLGILQTANLVTWAIPEFNRAYWHPDGDYVDVWMDGEDITTQRNEDGGTSAYIRGFTVDWDKVTTPQLQADAGGSGYVGVRVTPPAGYVGPGTGTANKFDWASLVSYGRGQLMGYRLWGGGSTGDLEDADPYTWDLPGIAGLAPGMTVVPIQPRSMEKNFAYTANPLVAPVMFTTDGTQRFLSPATLSGAGFSSRTKVRLYVKGIIPDNDPLGAGAADQRLMAISGSSFSVTVRSGGVIRATGGSAGNLDHGTAVTFGTPFEMMVVFNTTADTVDITLNGDTDGWTGLTAMTVPGSGATVTLLSAAGGSTPTAGSFERVALWIDDAEASVTAIPASAWFDAEGDAAAVESAWSTWLVNGPLL